MSLFSARSMRRWRRKHLIGWDPDEAQSELTQRTRLWERWSKRLDGACPFGIVLRAGATADCPFSSWAYRPSYLPATLSIDMAAGTPLEEPEFLYLGFQRARARQGLEPTSHRIPVNRLAGVGVSLPASVGRSSAAQALERTGLLSFTVANDYVISLTFDGSAPHKTADLRPHIPILLRW
jgi:hypothetical protein